MNGGPKLPQSCFSCNSYLKERNKKGSIEYNREEEWIHTAPFCLKCLDKLKLDEIDIDGIIENLTKKGYLKAPKIELLREALKNFKEEKMQERLDGDGTITYYFQEEK